MATYSREDIARVRSGLSIVEYLERQGVAFKQSGVNFSALCPLHSERSPSFHVNTAANTFHCFGCGAGGDTINLVQQMENLSFIGAMQFIAEETGIVLQAAENDAEYESLKKLYRACELASKYFREQYVALPADHAAKMNLTERGLQDEAAKDLTVGFATMKGLLDYMFSQRVSKEDLIAVGLVKMNEEGRLVQLFRNRLIWTICNIQGKPIAFSARKIFDNDNGPKYINSPSTRLYNKSKTLMGAEVAKKHLSKTGKIFIVEGATDIMALRSAGLENVVATCGTAFGSEHAQILTVLSNNVKNADMFRAVFCFDGDAAGLKAAREVFHKNPDIIKISQVVKFENGDPSEIRQGEGDEKLVEILTTTPKPITEFILQEELTLWNIDEPEQLDTYVKNSLALLRKSVSSVEYDGYMRKISQWTGLTMELLKNYGAHNNKQQKTTSRADKTNHSSDTIEDTLLALLMQYPNVILPLWEKYDVTDSYFSNTDVAEVLRVATGGKTKSEHISQYLVLEHNIHNNISARAESLIQMFLKNKYLEEIKEAENDTDLETYFANISVLKKKYHQT